MATSMKFMREKDLYDMKWFDYRHLRPTVATMVFFMEWARRFREFNYDSGRSRHFAFLKGFNGFSEQELTARPDWRVYVCLRQWADSNAMPYDLFWSYAFEALRKMGFTKTFIQVFLNKALLRVVKEDFEELCRHAVLYAKAPHLMPANYRGLAVQRDYCGYIVGLARKRTPKDVLMKRLWSLVECNKLPQQYVNDLQAA